ncbi:MAG: CRTAC1 family protein [Verrucomicrobiota bacterium]|nr:CRTAC1 family protein [Verrucomicrobiota bacterium]
MLALVLAVLIVGSVAVLLTPNKPLPAPKPSQAGGLVDEAVMQQVAAIEAKHRQWNSTVWVDEMTARQYGEVAIQIWDNLRAGIDPFQMIGDMPFQVMQLGQAQPAESWESGIRRVRLANGGPAWSPKQFAEALGQWRAAGWRLEQSEWRHRRFSPRAANGPVSVFWISLHLINDTLAKRGILRGDITVQWQSAAITPEALPQPTRIDLTGLEWLERTGAPAFTPPSQQDVPPNDGNIFIDPLILYDFNGDDRLEVILGCKNRIYRNLGEGRFKAEPLCPQFNETVFNVTLEDLSGDGMVDLVACGHEGIYMIEGQSDGRFPGPARLAWRAPEKVLDPMVMTTGDIDGDRDADLWLSQYKLPYVKGQMPTPIYDANDGFPGYLLLNDGTGRLSDATAAAGLASKRYRRSYSASFADIDDDRDLDLTIVSDFAGVDLFLNDGSGKFTDATRRLVRNRYGFGMAHNFADYNADGKMDLLMIGMNSWATERLASMNLSAPTHRHYTERLADITFGNRLYFGDGKKFTQRPMGDRAANTGWSWGATSFDADNDGDTDLFIANGHKSRDSVKDYERQFWCHDIYHANSEPNPAMEVYIQGTSSRLYGAGYSYGGYEKNRLLLNRENRSLDDVAYLMNASHEIDSRNVASGDIDGDGQLDLFFTHFSVWPEPGSQGLLMARNLWPGDNRWVGFRLARSASCPSLNGTKVRIRAGGRDQWRYIVNGDSYRSQHAPIAHFGLGQAEAEFVEIHWPTGQTTRLDAPPHGKYHDVTAPAE